MARKLQVVTSEKEKKSTSANVLFQEHIVKLSTQTAATSSAAFCSSATGAAAGSSPDFKGFVASVGDDVCDDVSRITGAAAPFGTNGFASGLKRTLMLPAPPVGVQLFGG